MFRQEKKMIRETFQKIKISFRDKNHIWAFKINEKKEILFSTHHRISIPKKNLKSFKFENWIFSWFIKFFFGCACQVFLGGRNAVCKNKRKT